MSSSSNTLKRKQRSRDNCELCQQQDLNPVGHTAQFCAYSIKGPYTNQLDRKAGRDSACKAKRDCKAKKSKTQTVVTESAAAVTESAAAAQQQMIEQLKGQVEQLVASKGLAEQSAATAAPRQFNGKGKGKGKGKGQGKGSREQYEHHRQYGQYEHHRQYEQYEQYQHQHQQQYYGEYGDYGGW